MTALRFCADCGRERAEGGEVISFTPDYGWTVEFSLLLADGQRCQEPTERTDPDGSRWQVWSEQMTGWAIVEQHFDEGDRHQRDIEPVMLADDHYSETLSEYKLDHNVSKARICIKRAGGVA
jgi:hypothetical protein